MLPRCRAALVQNLGHVFKGLTHYIRFRCYPISSLLAWGEHGDGRRGPCMNTINRTGTCCLRTPAHNDGPRRSVAQKTRCIAAPSSVLGAYLCRRLVPPCSVPGFAKATFHTIATTSLVEFDGYELFMEPILGSCEIAYIQGGRYCAVTGIRGIAKPKAPQEACAPTLEYKNTMNLRYQDDPPQPWADLGTQSLGSARHRYVHLRANRRRVLRKPSASSLGRFGKVAL